VKRVDFVIMGEIEREERKRNEGSKEPLISIFDPNIKKKNPSPHAPFTHRNREREREQSTCNFHFLVHMIKDAQDPH